MIRYYDRDGKELDGVLEWASKFEDAKYRFIQVDDVKGPDGRSYRVSTIWEGVDKRLYEDQEELLLFQTGAFLLKEVDEDGFGGFEGMVGEWLWPTEFKAFEGHQVIVDQVACGAIGANGEEEE